MCRGRISPGNRTKSSGNRGRTAFSAMLQYAFSEFPPPANSELRLSGKTVLITGASSGIGRACAVEFAREGANLILTGRRREALDRTAAAAGEGRIVRADLANSGSLRRFCDRILETTPTIDVLVHNAGVGIYAPSFATAAEGSRQLMDLNFLAPVELTCRLLPAVPARGSIVFVSSIAGKVPIPRLGVYCASKHALNAYAEVLRMETRDRGLHVMSVCPGYVKTPFTSNMLQGASEEGIPLRQRVALTPEQCAEAVVTGVLRRKDTVVLPRIGWLLVLAARAFPVTLQRTMMRLLSVAGDK